jgi:hypothetical protein
MQFVEESKTGVCCARALIFSWMESDMKLVGLCSIAVVLGSMTSLAQTAERKPSQPVASAVPGSTIVAGVVPGSINCPVDIRAKRGLGAGQIQRGLDNGQQDPGPSQNLHLTLTNSTYSEILGVRVTAYGLNSKGQFTPANLESNDSSSIQTTIELKLKVDPKAVASADIALAGFTSVTQLQIDSIRYSGGATWQPSARQTCHVVPDGLLLISHP